MKLIIVSFHDQWSVSRSVLEFRRKWVCRQARNRH